jgi:hypothetical protein
MLITAKSNYWLGTPTGYSSPILYSSISGALVPLTDAGYTAWLAAGNAPTPWPRELSGAVTTNALDAVLTAAGVSPTGLTFSVLQSATVAAASVAAAAVTAQIFTDPAHQAAAQNAAMIVATSGGAPASSSPFYAQFNSYAAAWGMTPANFSTLITVMTNQSLALSGALNALSAASTAATTPTQLATALATFETAIGNVVTALNAAGGPVTIIAPAAISIKGVNA